MMNVSLIYTIVNRNVLIFPINLSAPVLMVMHSSEMVFNVFPTALKHSQVKLETSTHQVGLIDIQKILNVNGG